MSNSKLPLVSAARNPSDSKEFVMIKRGDMGYYPWGTFDVGTARTPEEFNAAHGIDDVQAECMLAGSMFGWHVPGANPDAVRTPFRT